MKCVSVILSIFSIASATSNFDFQELNFGIMPSMLVENLTAILNDQFVPSNDDIGTIVNEYSHDIFANLQRYLNSHNFSSFALPNTLLKLKPSGTLNLTEGYLKGISTIEARKDIMVIYASSSKKLWLELPITFKNLQFIYDYHTEVCFINIHGSVSGNVKNIKINALISLDFNSYEGCLDQYNVIKSGSVNMKYTDVPTVDSLTNSMTIALQTHFGGVIMKMIAKFIRETLRHLIDKYNETMNVILH